MKVEFNAKEFLEVLIAARGIMRRYRLSMLQVEVLFLVASGRAASANKIAAVLGCDRHAVQVAVKKIEELVGRNGRGVLVLTDVGRGLVDKFCGSCFTLTQEDGLWDRS